MTRCDVQMMGDEFSRKPYALAVQQGSPLKDKLNDVYVGLNSTYFLLVGILQHLETFKSKETRGNERKVVESEP